jgi:hypothetical protein
MGGGRRPGPHGTERASHGHLNDGTLVRGLSPGQPPLGLAGTHGRRSSRLHRPTLAVVHRGSTGDDVKRLQRLLNVRLVPSPVLKVDGRFGNATYAATRVFQAGRTLKVDGIVGPATWAHLLAGQTVAAVRSAEHVKGQPPVEDLPLAPIPVIPITVWEWPFSRKMQAVVERLPQRLPGQMRREFFAMVQSDNLLLMLTMVGLFGMLSGGTALVIGAVALGMDVAMSLAACLQITALAANQAELDRAADELAHAVILGGVTVFVAGLTRVAGKAKGSQGRELAPEEPSPVAPRATAKPAPPRPPRLASSAPPSPTLLELRQLPRGELLKKIRAASDDYEIVLWEQVHYGGGYTPVVAGPKAAAKLGVREGEVIGYKVEAKAKEQSAIMGMAEPEVQELSPYGDVFLDYGPAPRSK